MLVSEATQQPLDCLILLRNHVPNLHLQNPSNPSGCWVRHHCAHLGLHGFPAPSFRGQHEILQLHENWVSAGYASELRIPHFFPLSQGELELEHSQPRTPWHQGSLLEVPLEADSSFIYLKPVLSAVKHKRGCSLPSCSETFEFKFAFATVW